MSELMDNGKEAGLRALLQVALDELGHVVDAVDHQHDTKPGMLKYGTPYAAITGARKIREDCLAQAAMWGLDIAATRATSKQDDILTALKESIDWIERLCVSEDIDPRHIYAGLSINGETLATSLARFRAAIADATGGGRG